MGRKRWIAVLVGIGIAGGGYLIFCLIVDCYEHYQRTLPQRREAERAAYLNQQVKGYATADDVASGSLKVTTVEYFGGRLKEVQYAKGGLVYRERPGMPGTPVRETPVEINDRQRELLTDILNLICKQELWRQGDQLPSTRVCDGGETAYRFSVKGHQGQFKAVNTDPKHLEIFRHKCRRLLESCRPEGR